MPMCFCTITIFKELRFHMSVIDQLLAFITEIVQYVDLFQALIVFLGFFGIVL